MYLDTALCTVYYPLAAGAVPYRTRRFIQINLDKHAPQDVLVIGEAHPNCKVQHGSVSMQLKMLCAYALDRLDIAQLNAFSQHSTRPPVTHFKSNHKDKPKPTYADAQSQE
jgi:hypothetical protein